MTYQEIIKSHPLVLVDFTASWCGPCKALAPILHDVKSELKDALKIVKIDIDQNPNIAASHSIQGVPTMILYKEGVQVWRQSGVLPKHQLLAIIQQS